MKKELADLIERDCLTHQGEIVTVKGIITDDRLPPRAIVYQKGASNMRHFWVSLLRPLPLPQQP